MKNSIKKIFLLGFVIPSYVMTNDLIENNTKLYNLAAVITIEYLDLTQKYNNFNVKPAEVTTGIIQEATSIVTKLRDLSSQANRLTNPPRPDIAQLAKNSYNASYNYFNFDAYNIKARGAFISSLRLLLQSLRPLLDKERKIECNKLIAAIQKNK